MVCLFLGQLVDLSPSFCGGIFSLLAKLNGVVRYDLGLKYFSIVRAYYTMTRSHKVGGDILASTDSHLIVRLYQSLSCQLETNLSHPGSSLLSHGQQYLQE